MNALYEKLGQELVRKLVSYKVKYYLEFPDGETLYNMDLPKQSITLEQARATLTAAGYRVSENPSTKRFLLPRGTFKRHYDTFINDMEIGVVQTISVPDGIAPAHYGKALRSAMDKRFGSGSADIAIDEDARVVMVVRLRARELPSKHYPSLKHPTTKDNLDPSFIQPTLTGVPAK